MRERYTDIARVMVKEINKGTYPKGARVPNRLDLADRFNVSGATIDRTVRLLIDKGVLEARRGAGTFVKNKRVAYKIAVISRRNTAPDLPQHDECSFVPLIAEDFERRSDSQQLKEFDGILWYRPERPSLPVIEAHEGRGPQIVINREFPEFDSLNFVTTNHSDSIYQITKERLGKIDGAQPVFLRSTDMPEDFVADLRQKGFVQACREAGVFYEVFDMPKTFAEKVCFLEKYMAPHMGKKLLFVADAVFHTGAVLRWVLQNKLEWKKDIWYSDYDNDIDTLILGVKVTSFLQDGARMFDTALESLLEMLEGRAEPVRLKIPAMRIDGDT